MDKKFFVSFYSSRLHSPYTPSKENLYKFTNETDLEIFSVDEFDSIVIEKIVSDPSIIFKDEFIKENPELFLNKDVLRKYLNKSRDNNLIQHTSFLDVAESIFYKRFSNNISTSRYAELLKSLYNSLIYEEDQHFNSIIETLKQEGLLNKTIIIFYSDHGEEFGEHGAYDHWSNIYDEVIHTPLTIFIPGMEGKEIGALSQGVDIMPTILDLVGIKTPNQTQGKSLFPVIIETKKSVREYAFSESLSSTFSIRSKDWKYITDFGNVEEIYNLKQDPNETNNLITSNINKYNELKKKLIFHINTELYSDLLTDKTIHLNSEELKKFELIESSELKDKTLYSFINNNEYLKIEKTENINDETAKKLIDKDIIQIKALFSSSLSPYPGEISNEIECADEFKPILFKTEIGGNECQYMTTYSNDRFGIGVCSKDLIKFRYLIGWIYCPKIRELYKVRYFISMEENYEKLKEVFINLECNN